VQARDIGQAQADIARFSPAHSELWADEGNGVATFGEQLPVRLGTVGRCRENRRR
jgi:hypothetical protein